MATRRGRQRNVPLSRSTNYGAVTRGARGVRRLVATYAGEPASRLLSPGADRIRGVRTLIKKDIAKGVTQPEYRQAMLMDQGVHMSGKTQGVTIRQQRPETPTPTRANVRVIKPPRPAPGGIRNPYNLRKKV